MGSNRFVLISYLYYIYFIYYIYLYLFMYLESYVFVSCIYIIFSYLFFLRVIIDHDHPIINQHVQSSWPKGDGIQAIGKVVG